MEKLGKLRIPNKSFQEIVATNLYNIFQWNLMALFIALLFAIVLFSGAKVQGELTQISSYYLVFFAILIIANLVFVCFYVPRRIISRIEGCPSKTRYDILILHRATVRLLLFGVIVTSFAIGLDWLAETIGQGVAQNLLLQKAYTFITYVGMATFVLGFLYVFPVSVGKEKEAQLSFETIQDFENIAGDKNRQSMSIYWSINVWKFLMRQIVYATESTVRECLETSEEFHSNFYKPFNTISLAVILGNSEQKRKAKEWVAKLGNIVTENETEDSAKTELIIEHFEQVEKNECFRGFQLAHDKYGFQYDFEYGWKKLGATLGKTGQIIAVLFGIGEFIFLVVRFMFFGT